MNPASQPREPLDYRPQPPTAREAESLWTRTGNWIMRHHRTLLLDAVLILIALLFLAPVLLMFITSFKTSGEILQFERLFPSDWAAGWRENYAYVLGTPEEIPVFRWLFNSIFISSSVTLLVLTVDSLAAYALARLDLPGGKLVFGLIVATLMVPGQILLVPVYLILNRLGWLDSPLALIIPAGATAFGVFLLWSFMKGIPVELEEAAALDGCGPWRTFWHVMLPLCRPALATLGIFTFIGSYNDFLGPLVFLDSVEKYTLPVGVALFQTSYITEYGLTLAASVICTVPILLVFLVLHRQIVAGISMSGLKG